MKTQNIQLDGVKTRFFTEVDTPEKIIRTKKWNKKSLQFQKILCD